MAAHVQPSLLNKSFYNILKGEAVFCRVSQHAVIAAVVGIICLAHFIRSLRLRQLYKTFLFGKLEYLSGRGRNKAFASCPPVSSTSDFRLYYCWKKMTSPAHHLLYLPPSRTAPKSTLLTSLGLLFFLSTNLGFPLELEVTAFGRSARNISISATAAVECPDIGPYDPLGNLIPEVILAYLHGFLLRGRFFTLHAKVSNLLMKSMADSSFFCLVAKSSANDIFLSATWNLSKPLHITPVQNRARLQFRIPLESGTAEGGGN